jgi:hypothetical protein
VQKGPFNRRETDIQTPALALEQVRSGEIWGLTPKNGGLEPTVQAYAGRLKTGGRGIEFTTDTAPHSNGSPFEARWYLTLTPGVLCSRKNGIDHACILADVENHQL